METTQVTGTGICAYKVEISPKPLKRKIPEENVKFLHLPDFRMLKTS